MYVHTSREVYDIRLHVFTGSCECVSFRAVRVIQCKRKSNVKGHDRKRGNLMKLLKSPSHKFHSVARIWVQEKCPESCPVLKFLAVRMVHWQDFHTGTGKESVT